MVQKIRPNRADPKGWRPRLKISRAAARSKVVAAYLERLLDFITSSTRELIKVEDKIQRLAVSYINDLILITTDVNSLTLKIS